MDMIYLDHAATTPVRKEVLECMLPWLSCNTGNASSLHSAGKQSRAAINQARANISELIGAEHANDIIFTSGGTESDNMALSGMSPSLIQSGKRVILTSEMEHHAILNQIPHIDLPIQKAPVCSNGVVDLGWIEDRLNRFDVGLVSIMAVNNETGVKQPINEIADLCRKYGAIFHTDAVQAIGHMEINVSDVGIDLLSLSGHKFGAPDGIGALYISKRVRDMISPISYGGGQELGLRPGTENVAGIVGLGAAAHILMGCMREEITQYELMSKMFIKHLRTYGCDFQVNFENQNRVGNILSLYFPGVESELLLRMCDADRLCISAASACSSGSKSPSHVLTACGFTDDKARSTVRISFGHTTTIDEINLASVKLFCCVRKIREMFRK